MKVLTINILSMWNKLFEVPCKVFIILRQCFQVICGGQTRRWENVCNMIQNSTNTEKKQKQAMEKIVSKIIILFYVQSAAPKCFTFWRLNVSITWFQGKLYKYKSKIQIWMKSKYQQNNHKRCTQNYTL